MAWTTTELVSRALFRAGRPDADPDFTSAVVLTIADDVIVERILPAIHATREEYGVTSTDYAVTAGQADYRIPSRAAFGVIREATYIDANGLGYDLPLVDVEQIDTYATSDVSPIGHAIEGDRVVLVPEPTSTSGTLRLRYYRRPSVLVAASTGSDEAPHAITSGATTTTLTIGTHAFDEGDLIDIVQAQPPFDVLAQGISVVNPTGTTIGIVTAVTTAATGDYVCTAGETPVPHLPAELHAVLAIGVAAEILRRTKDPQAGDREAEFERKLGVCVSAMQPRNHGEPPKIINRFSPLRQGRRWARRWLT